MNYMSNSFIIPHFSGDIRKKSTRNLNIAPPSKRWVRFWVAEEPLRMLPQNLPLFGLIMLGQESVKFGFPFQTKGFVLLLKE